MKKVISKLFKLFNRKKLSTTEEFLEASKDPSKHMNMDPAVFKEIMVEMENTPSDKSLTTKQIIDLSSRNREYYVRHNNGFPLKRINEDTFECVVQMVPMTHGPSIEKALERGNPHLFCEYGQPSAVRGQMKMHVDIANVCGVLFDITTSIRNVRNGTHNDMMTVISAKFRLFGPSSDKLREVIEQAEKDNMDIQMSFASRFMTGYKDRHTELIMVVISFDVVDIKSIPSTSSTEE